jgi:DNA-binding CsgD family transcriptional regulator
MGSVGILLERAPELEAVHQVLSGTREGRGGCVVFRGAAGLGKSTLLSAGTEAARTSGRVVLSARASALESHVPFGLARKLVAPLLRDAGDHLLAGDGALATPLFSSDWTRSSGADVSLGVQEGLCAILANATVPPGDAEDTAVTLVLDDLQWADRPSLRFLLALLGRIDDLAVTVLCAHRAERDGESVDLLDLLEDDPATVVRTLRPLSDDGALQVVRHGLGERADEDLASACVRATGGNPFYLWELVRELRDAGPEMPSAAAVARTVPASVTRSVAVRLARLPADAAAVARALAVLGDDTDLPVVARLAGLAGPAAAAASDALAGAAIIEPTEPLRFVHSLVGSAIHDDMSPFARTQLHRRAAEQLLEDGAPASQVAAQLMVARPQGDRRAAAVLREAAAFAQSRGEPKGAVTLLERALAEEPPPAERAALLVDLAGADIRVGASGAGARLEEALALLDDPAHQARTLQAHSAVLHHAGDFEGAARACRRGLDLVVPDDPLADQLRAGFVGAGLLSPSMLADARAELERLLDEGAEDTGAQPPALWALLAARAAERGDPDGRVLSLAERAFALDPLVEADSLGMSLGYASQALIWVDALAAAERLVGAAAEAARGRGAFMALAIARLNQATVAYHQGRLDDAVALADQALEVRRYGWTDSTWSTPVLAMAHLERGDLDAARAAIALGESANSARSDHAMLLEARARLVLAQGDAAAALADARAAGELVEGEFQARCSRLFRWRVIAARAAHLLGDDQARILVDDALDEARELGTSRQLGETLTAAGLVAGGPEGLALHEEAVGVLEASPSRLQLAHSLVELGAARRRQGQRTAAGEPLGRALELADELGATPLVGRARHELGLLGVRPRRSARTGPESLTPGERAVAELAAAGLGNVQIAQRLFIARKTVESHLASAYRKLGIKARGDLAAALGSGPPR